MIQEIFCKAARYVSRRAACRGGRARDGHRCTYAAEIPSGRLNRYCFRLDEALLRPLAAQILALARLWLSHHFDLLGSGWVQVRHGMQCQGLDAYRYDAGPSVQADKDGYWLEGRINRANLAEARRIWQLVDEGYTPIDWQLDFKSGYRWSEKTWHEDVRYGHRPGADVKVPWELARMQHLPQLAWAQALAMANAPEFQPAGVYAREFRNQVLDFVATNPPRFGVNWRCTMDVAIRVANWLVAYDLFRCWGADFDAAFEAVFLRSVYEHGLHIINHLERLGNKRGNHYLANIAGLLFVAAYLPSSATVDAWLAFAVEELIAEADFQFHQEGSHFEASTSYHRLAAEFVAYATSLALALRGDERVPAFPPWYPERLGRIAEFSRHMTKPNGRVHQVGDNDSGRFLGLRPSTEESLDHQGLIAAVSGLFGDAGVEHFGTHNCIEAAVVRGLCGDASFGPQDLVSRPWAESPYVGRSRQWSVIRDQLRCDAELECFHQEIPLPFDPLDDEIGCHAYPAFGVYVFRSSRLYLAVRCGRLSPGNSGGHSHYDQLAVELCVDGEDWIADPGAYLYTPDPALRRAYRSAAAHFVPHLKGGREPASPGDGLFHVHDVARGECLVFEPFRFLGRHSGFGTPIYRLLELESRRIRIEDYAVCRLPLELPSLVCAGSPFAPIAFSAGYGLRGKR